ncbi:cation:proton antiporter [Maribius pontilimi]|uniref:Cation:proton antiporter n=1 Tax=Palleronia pontilimi TaxID=1964209 RepID=A0A934IHQ2_9RHOB|nr:cation:proton antiporter [Palleronia pontilimi]MBJ3762089.1 cation:proton antiporter [Palleronia pontilimi]
MESFLFQATIYLAAAVIAVPLAARLGFGSVLGYLAAGIVIGPVLGLVGSETQDLQHFAEFGVVMMLFLIGLELEPKALWDMRHRLIGLGGSQVLLTMGLISGAAIWLGQPPGSALAIGMIFALSSTAIVLQTLNEKRLMQTGGGRSSFSVLLTQDIAVIPMLAFLPLLAVRGGGATAPGGAGSSEGATTAGANAQAAISVIEALPGWGITLATILAIGIIIVGGVFGMRPVFRFIHRAGLRELYTALALLIVISIAFMMTLVGLSPALGTFLAGVVLANSEFRHELESDIEPFKGLLLGLFFITVGAGISFTSFFAAPFVVLGLTLGVMAVKGVILYALGLIFKLKSRDRWLFTLGLCGAGEFGFVLVSFSTQTGVLSTPLAERILLVVAFSMLLTPLFFILWEFLSTRWAEEDEDEAIPADEIDHKTPIIIAGIGRFGQVVNRMLQLAGFETTVLDNDLDTIQLMRKFGFKGFFGDPTRPELLHAAGLDDAKVLVVTMDSPADVTALVEYARSHRPDLHIVARAYDRNHVYELYRAGANDIVREVFDSSLRAGRYVLENIGLTEFEASELEKAFFKIDRSALRELAELWQPGVPIARNEAYMERARALNKDLEFALSAKYDEMRGLDTDVSDDEDETEGATGSPMTEDRVA